jgi:hypothetical protein
MVAPRQVSEQRNAEDIHCPPPQLLRRDLSRERMARQVRESPADVR